MSPYTNRDILRSQLQMLLLCYYFSQKNTVVRTLCSLNTTYVTTSHRTAILLIRPSSSPWTSDC